MRFEAPARERLLADTFQHPAYAGFPHVDLLKGAEWPSLSRLNAGLGGACHPETGKPLRFVAQTPALLADGLHYESRIYHTGAIATRENSWHDLFNVLMWLDRRQIKSAINTAYTEDQTPVCLKTRSRRQYALTHFDEAGAVVVVPDTTLLPWWDQHDWQQLLLHHRPQWQTDVRIVLFGHALLEHFLLPGILPVAKCLVVQTTCRDECQILEMIGRAIRTNQALTDPQELRPLPLSGCGGWHPESHQAIFFNEAPCFRPLRAGRRYPTPLSLDHLGALSSP